MLQRPMPNTTWNAPEDYHYLDCRDRWRHPCSWEPNARPGVLSRVMSAKTRARRLISPNQLLSNGLIVRGEECVPARDPRSGRQAASIIWNH